MNDREFNPKFPLRGKGPRVYISYSFKDQALATSINHALTARGLQVTQDDAESLVSQHLPTALSARIENSEVLLCLLTEIANRSNWCRQEIDLALRRVKDTRSLKLLPVVFSTENLYAPISEWSYIDATRHSFSAGIPLALVDKIHKECLGVVELLPLSKNNPFSFDYERVSGLIEHGRD
ncbi:MAG: toll/interleukin-1 receptor domain-containing protein [bacterium]|nr:toll/interleukin-1 receptor domain-containing protein [bacterium]